MAIDDIWQFDMVCAQGNQISINRLFFIVTVQPAAWPGDQLLADTMSGNAGNFYKPLLCDVSSYRGLLARKLTLPPPLPPRPSVAGKGPGTGATGALPCQVSGIITLLTGLAGRKFRGRLYIPFPGPSDSTAAANPVPTDAYVGKLTNFAVNIISSFDVDDGAGNTAHLSPIIYHRSGGTDTLVIGHRSNKAWATQRRRGDYGRPNVPPV
jgi:hypothetical protein